MPRPQLLVDVSAIMQHDAQTGIQRVVRAVWSELLTRSGKDFDAKPVYASNRHGFRYAPVDFLEKRPRSESGLPVSLAPGDKFLGLDLSAHLLPKFVEQLCAWRLNGGSVHIVVYDLLPLQRPEWFTKAASRNFRKWIDLVTSGIDQAICISDDVAAQLAALVQEPTAPRIGRIYMGSDMSASLPSSGMTKAIHEVLHSMHQRPSVLMVGTIEPRKGYDVALDAFEHLWHADPKNCPDLVIVGKAGWKTAELQNRLLTHEQLGLRLRWLDRVSDQGLARLYEAAKGVLVTSRAEGFGLPLVEAALHRRHVLARDLPVFREQALPNVLYFDDDSPAALARRLSDLMKLSSDCLPAMDLLSWRESVDRLLVELRIREDTTHEVSRALCQVQ